MYTNKDFKASHVYKVTFEHLPTGHVMSISVESTSAFQAGESVISSLGDNYDLVQAILVHSSDLN